MAVSGIKFVHIELMKDLQKPSLRSRIWMKMEGGGGWRQKKSAVDENMIILRRRIHEVKMKEEDYYAPPSSSKWWEWEKRWYSSHSADVVEIVGLLQIAVMSARPVLVLGTGAFLVISMVLAMYVILYTLVGCVAGLAIL